MQRFLDGEYVMPAAKITPTDSTNAEGPKEVPNPAYISWRRSDRLLCGWITGTLSKEVLGIVVGLTTSREVWDVLEEAYAQDSQEREFNLTQAMTTLRKGNDSLIEYLRKFKAICDELAAMGKPVPDKTKAFWVLQGLGQGYENFVTTMLKPPVPPYREVVSLLKSHETRNQIHGFDSYNHPQVTFYGQRTNGNQNKRKGNGFNKFNSKGKGFFQGNGTNSTYNSASANYFSHAGNRNVGSNFTRNQPNNFNK
ncbi:hypothetical protein SLE2022_246340 [Rubroshorea leprosula]